MALVKAPNGTVMDLDESVVSGLVGSVDSAWERVDDSKTEQKSTAKRSSSSTKK